MTELTDNELIARFMGYKVDSVNYNLPHCWRANHWEPMEFHISWDWLMSVVEKIEKLYNDKFPHGEEFVRRVLAHEEIIEQEYMDVVGLPIATPINEVYSAVVKFIKWYTSNPQKP